MVLWQAVGEHVQLLVLAASSLVFAAPVPWSKREVLTMMSESGRLQSVTLPSLIERGGEFVLDQRWRVVSVSRRGALGTLTHRLFSLCLI